jgi:hypothetical protein
MSCNVKSRLLKITAVVSFASALVGGLSGCVTYGNTHALITPVGVAGYHTFKPSQPVRDINLPEQRNADKIAAVKALEAQTQAADSDT